MRYGNIRSRAWLAGLAVMTAALASLGCGYAGEPKPPALLRPTKVTDLSATERGSKIVISYIMPWETTEGIPLNGSADVELRVGPAVAPFDEARFRAGSDRVPVPEERVVRPAPGAVAASGASAASGKRSLIGRLKSAAAKPTTPARPVAPPRTSLIRTITLDAAKYAGKTVTIGVLVHGPKGRDDGWSTTQLEVLPVLAAPLGLKATDAPNAVHLEWSSDAAAFRIFRKLREDKDWTQIADGVTAKTYDDKSMTYGKTWQYFVEAVRKMGDRVSASDPSETFTFTPVDHFPPAVPAGLTAIAGTKTVELYWEPVTDADLAGYRVYRNGVKVADALTGAVYSDKEVTVGSKYSYQVTAVDQAGNESGKSGTAEVTME